MNTEAEASELWCPMARYTYGSATHNRHYNGNDDVLPPECMCIASKCAMWRWAGIIHKYVDGTVHDLNGGDAKGFCGLAGLPS